MNSKEINPLPDTKVRSETDDSGIGGDESFCQHGNLLWSEDCDECSKEIRRISDAITNARRES